MKKALIIIICMSGAVYAQVKKTTATRQTVTTKPVPLKNATDSFSYALGVNIASNLHAQGIDQVDFTSLQKAMSDIFAKKTPLLTDAQCKSAIQGKLVSSMTKKLTVIKEEGKNFLAANKKRQGVVELPDGLQYEIIKQGTGQKPMLTDTVKANYIGKLMSGQEFDNSYTRGQPLQIAVNAVIPGWTQALQMMPVGSKWRLYIPSNLGYGDNGAGNVIPGGATLIFDIELLDVIKAAQK